MKSVDVNNKSYIDFGKESNNKDHKFKVDDHVRNENIKIFLLKNIFQTGLKNILWLKKLKMQGHDVCH